MWVEEFEGTFADLVRTVTFVLDVAASCRNVGVPSAVVKTRLRGWPSHSAI